MRINKFIAQSSNLSRRAADEALRQNRVTINNELADLGASVQAGDKVTLDDKPLLANTFRTLILNKPIGYVCSRDGQGSATIYELLPDELHDLNPIGRLDKDTSGLLMMTNDGALAHKLSHPSFQKEKVYTVTLGAPISSEALERIKKGVEIEDGLSKFDNVAIKSPRELRVTLHEGRNRQIRRTFEALGFRVKKLHRTKFSSYDVKSLGNQLYKLV